jgi:hypothetical protein
MSQIFIILWIGIFYFNLYKSIFNFFNCSNLPCARNFTCSRLCIERCLKFSIWYLGYCQLVTIWWLCHSNKIMHKDNRTYEHKELDNKLLKTQRLSLWELCSPKSHCFATRAQKTTHIQPLYNYPLGKMKN